MIIANGGTIARVRGVLVFVLAPDAHAKIEHRLGRKIPWQVPLEPRWCNRSAPFLPTLGGHTDPKTGDYCHPERIPAEWSYAWQGL